MTNTRTNKDGFRGEYPKWVDVSELPPATFPWLEKGDPDAPQGEKEPPSR